MPQYQCRSRLDAGTLIESASMPHLAPNCTQIWSEDIARKAFIVSWNAAAFMALGKFVEKNTVFDNFDVFVDWKNHLLQGPVVAKSRMVHILFAKVWGLATSCSRTLSWKSVLLGHVAHRNHRISIVV